MDAYTSGMSPEAVITAAVTVASTLAIYSGKLAVDAFFKKSKISH